MRQITGGNTEPLGQRCPFAEAKTEPVDSSTMDGSIDVGDHSVGYLSEFDLSNSNMDGSFSFCAAASFDNSIQEHPEISDADRSSRSFPKKDSSRDKEQDGKRRRSRSREKDRKRSRSRDRHEKKRSRSRERSSRRTERRRSSRDRDSGRRERSRSKGRDRERDRDRDYDRDRDRIRVTPGVLPPNIQANTPQSFIPPLFASPTPSAMGDQQSDLAADGKKKRKSRWAAAEERAFVPGMPTMIPSNLSEDQKKLYLLQLQIEELSRKLRTGDFGIPANPEERSPSPEPQYDNRGQRLNTREFRTRKKLEEQRHELIQNMIKANPLYRPPPDYKAPIIKLNDRVWIPQDEHPEINFVGLLIGPRGNTLKALEKETGAKIIIRGKGSVKEGKLGRKDGNPLPGEDEPLHAYITSTNPDCIKKASERIKQIIREGLEVPEQQNDLRKMQLRELALLNGTLRAEDMGGMRCGNCGANTHKTWECPDRPNITHGIVCTICGGAGHLSKDCKSRPPGMNPREFLPPPGGFMGMGGMAGPKAGLDDEYTALMAELGESGGGLSGYGRKFGSKPSLFGSGPAPALEAGPGGGGEAGMAQASFSRPPVLSQRPMFTVNLAEKLRQRMPLPQPLFSGGGAKEDGKQDGSDYSAYGSGIPPPPMPPPGMGYPGMMPPYGMMGMGFPFFPSPVPPPPPPPPSGGGDAGAASAKSVADAAKSSVNAMMDSMFNTMASMLGGPPPPPPT